MFAIARTLTDPSCADETAGKVVVEIIAGKVPYQYTLVSKANKIERSGRITDKKAEQAELKAGDYVLKVSDGNRDEIVRNFSLAMPDALYINLGPDQKLITGKDITLDVSAQVPDSIVVTYRWENNFGFNSTEKKIPVTESGIYRVFVTKQKDGCVFTDDMTVNGAEAQRVAVYPTILQSNEKYNVSISLDEPGSVVVKVFNLSGTQVHEMNDSGKSEFQFITSLKDAGMHLVVIQTRKGIETRKVIVY